MREIVHKFVPVLAISLSALFSYLLIGAQSFPYLGVALTLYLLSTFVFILKKDKQRIDTLSYIATLLFSFCIMWRVNYFLTLVNLLAVLYFGSILSLSKDEQKNPGFIKLALSPVLVIFESVKTKTLFPFTTIVSRNYIHNLKNNTDNVKSVCITVFLLLVIIPLLASANPLFANLFSVFQLQYISELISIDILLARVILFVVFLFIIPKLLSFARSEKNLTLPFNYPTNLPLLLPKIAVSLVLALFFITQAKLYFSDIETLKALDYTYSDYAREVFGQLSVVAGIIIGLLYNDKSKDQKNKLLTYILTAEGIFLTLMALKSVNDYSNQWGFTEKRLWGYAGVFWLLSVFAFYLSTYVKNLKATVFVKAVIAISALTLFGINAANFDYLIYNNRKSVTARGADQNYLSRLSPDSHSYNRQLQELIPLMNNTYKTKEEYLTAGIPLQRTLSNIKRVQEKYSSFDIRTFNFSDYQEYKNVKDIDVNEYLNTWDALYPNESTP